MNIVMTNQISENPVMLKSFYFSQTKIPDTHELFKINFLWRYKNMIFSAAVTF